MNAWLPFSEVGSQAQGLLLLFAVALGSLSIGCVLGRRWGRSEGLALGRAEAPLRLREQALEAGRCPVCAGLIRYGDALASEHGPEEDPRHRQGGDACYNGPGVMD